MKVLAIGAHADYIELGLGGTIAKHVQAGDEVHNLIVTNSQYFDFNGKLIRSRSDARKEAIDAANICGIPKSNVHFFDRLTNHFPTKQVVCNELLIETINSKIDELKPDIIYTHWDGDINQDHHAIAKATVIAARNISRVLMYQSNWYKSVDTFNGNYFVDISDQIEIKVKSINAHKSEVSKRGPSWIEFFKNQCRNNGIQVGVSYAEVFQLVKFLS